VHAAKENTAQAAAPANTKRFVGRAILGSLARQSLGAETKRAA